MKIAYRMTSNPKVSRRYSGTASKAANGNAVWTGEVRLWEAALEQPFGWKKPRRIFVNSMSDQFHPGLPNTAIARVWAVMALNERHTFQVLTKRAARMERWLSDPATPVAVEQEMRKYNSSASVAWPLRNVWVGVSVEDQERARERIPALLKSPAQTRFISVEPLLGPVDIAAAVEGAAMSPTAPSLKQMGLDWVIAGGESGLRARPMHPDWARRLRDECAAGGVDFFFKQRGQWCWDTVRSGAEMRALMPDGADVPMGSLGATILCKVGTKLSGELLDGRLHQEFPR
jgi:protein gp37